ncbi:TPA: IS3 family transposase [Yersinia enterocolitica]|nr:IS3 family transposase [Yersinia enterocolitica]
MRLLSRLLDVHPSGYYVWLQQPARLVVSKEHELIELIRQLWCDSGREYGYRRIFEDLRDLGEVCSLSHVRAIMKKVRAEEISGISYLSIQKEESIVDSRDIQAEQYFHPPLPNLRWISGTSSIATREGRLNLAIIIDLFSGRIIQWVLHEDDVRELQLRALQFLLLGKQLQRKVLVHLDSTTQYTHKEWRSAFREVDPEGLISRRGPCRELRLVTSFFQWLLDERIRVTVYATKHEVPLQILNLIDIFNSQQGLDSELNPLLPRMISMDYGSYGFFDM